MQATYITLDVCNVCKPLRTAIANAHKAVSIDKDKIKVHVSKHNVVYLIGILRHYSMYVTPNFVEANNEALGTLISRHYLRLPKHIHIKLNYLADQIPVFKAYMMVMHDA